MACAKPVVGAEVGGIKHSVVEGVTGFLVPAHDPQALAERLQRLHDDPELARAMGLAGAQRVRDNFTWQRVASELAHVYDEVREQVEAVDRRPVRLRRHRAVAPTEATA
jgi:glycosyltransferase involved in cell wall biosynthesis